jgi:hypothetical protein
MLHCSVAKFRHDCGWSAEVAGYLKVSYGGLGESA